jgi:hypothetical protein
MGVLQKRRRAGARAVVQSSCLSRDAPATAAFRIF